MGTGERCVWLLCDLVVLMVIFIFSENLDFNIMPL